MQHEKWHIQIRVIRSRPQRSQSTTGRRSLILSPCCPASRGQVRLFVPAWLHTVSATQICIFGVLDGNINLPCWSYPWPVAQLGKTASRYGHWWFRVTTIGPEQQFPAWQIPRGPERLAVCCPWSFKELPCDVGCTTDRLSENLAQWRPRAGLLQPAVM